MVPCKLGVPIGVAGTDVVGARTLNLAVNGVGAPICDFLGVSCMDDLTRLLLIVDADDNNEREVVGTGLVSLALRDWAKKG
jgi:hypothetical protein